MGATGRTYFYWSDWLGDAAVRRLTLAERGLWIDCLALMATASPIGYLCDDQGSPISHEELARITNAATPTEVTELLDRIHRKGVVSLDRTGRLYSRRMVRDASKAAKLARNGQLGGRSTRLKWQRFSGLPGHLPQHLPQQQNAPPYLKESKITKNLSGTARASRDAVPAGASSAAQKKRPSDWSREELEAVYAAQKAKAKGNGA